METFITFLEKRVDDCSSLLCIGLDPHIKDLQHKSAKGALDYCVNLVHETSKYAAAYKPNAAFFEYFGSAGWRALKKLIEAIQIESDRLGSRIPVILDAKRGDISSTAEAYAYSAFYELKADAITLSPYLGWDSIEPFLDIPEKGVFVLCKTSNPGSGDIQDLELSQSTVYERVAEQAQKYNTRNNIGIVVGATHPEAVRRIRSIVPGLWFLAPGVGAQGGSLEAVMAAGIRPDGKGVLINASRSIARSDDPGNTAAELRNEIINFKYNYTRSIGKATQFKDPIYELADELLEAGCIKFGDFKLKSGLKSPIYIDLRELVSYPKLLKRVAKSYIPLLSQLIFNRLAGLPYAALPIATAISLQTGYPFIYPRKEIKEYGTKSEIEGTYNPAETVVIIDDLATTGGSKFEAIEKLTSVGLLVKDIVVLIDRESGASQALAAAGLQMHAVLKLTEMLDYWESVGRVSKDLVFATRKFLSGS